MSPKLLKYINQDKQDKFSSKRENTCKSLEFSKRDKYFCPPTVSCQRRATVSTIKILVHTPFSLIYIACLHGTNNEVQSS